jgi:hypothetical protein
MSEVPIQRDARAEAQQLAGPAVAVRVLEPSPPAITDQWFADDPTAADGPALQPFTAAARSWDGWLADNPQHRHWAARRWLGAHRRLGEAPAHLAATRDALHRLAAYVISPARRRVNGKIGLRWTLGGFGTPFFGDDRQVRVEGDRLVVQHAGGVASEAITTLRRAAEFVLDGPIDRAWAEPFDIPPPGDVERPLSIDEGAAAFVSDWYGFGTSVLEELRHDERTTNASRVQLWPEHFDVAVELLEDAKRASYGASPGDAANAEPYLYVSVWNELPGPDPFWNATTFRGARLGFSSLAAMSSGAEQRAAALAFMVEARDRLISG